MNSPRTLFEKIWDRHVVAQEPERPAILYIDLHLIHEVTSPQAFAGIRKRGLPLRRPDRTFATMDHSTPTRPGGLDVIDDEGRLQIQTLVNNCQEFSVPLAQLNDENHGIVHVIGPEMGLTQPGMTIVCGDSHTSTHGAFGSLAFGIGTSEVEHVFATQCLLQSRPKSMEVVVSGELAAGVTAKDMILALIAQIGTDGGSGHVIEYRGDAVEKLDMEGRMCLCNMSIEAGARAGMVAPDERTFEYLEGRDRVPKGEAWVRSVADWKTLPTDPGAVFDKTVELDASLIEPMVTFGTNPAMGVGVTTPVPALDVMDTSGEAKSLAKALEYMGVQGGKTLRGKAVDVVFIGSCTNSRISDLRDAARVLRGHKVASNVEVLVVPGSMRVKKQAEAEGLHEVFLEAGAQWREPGCSMCIAMNGDQLSPGQVAVSTSNRNFEGRQGKGGRTILASPFTAAAAAIEGRVADPRPYL